MGWDVWDEGNVVCVRGRVMSMKSVVYPKLKNSCIFCMSRLREKKDQFGISVCNNCWTTYYMDMGYMPHIQHGHVGWSLYWTREIT